jgi:hypothetical protein
MFGKLAAAGHNTPEDYKVFLFSNSLPIEYHSFRSTIANQNHLGLKFRAVSTKLLHEYEQLTASVLLLDQGSAGSNNSTTAFTDGRLPDTYRNPRPDNLPQDTRACYKKRLFGGHSLGQMPP